MSFNYKQDFSTLDFRETPEKYQIGKGEQGVLLVEPYKSEIVKYWRFRTPEIARESAQKIYELYLEYRKNNEFVGMDMCRKFLEMGFTRSRRYANHPSGQKYQIKAGKKQIRQQAPDAMTSPKAESARIFKQIRDQVVNDPLYQKLRKNHKELEKQQLAKSD